MKKTLSLLLAMASATLSYAQSDLTKGSWFNQEKEAKIQFFSQGDQVNGKIIWLKKGPDILDTKNPNAQLQKRKLVGTVILSNLKANGTNSWSDGSVYDPKSGKTYDAKMKLVNANTLEVRGYMGSPLLGRTTTFTRADAAQ